MKTLNNLASEMLDRKNWTGLSFLELCRAGRISTAQVQELAYDVTESELKECGIDTEDAMSVSEAYSSLSAEIANTINS